MTGYYAFNSRDFVHAIDPQTPAVIIELGFLTNPEDRELLQDRQDLLAAALADGILRYLMSQGQ
jgi:N-acetylmuramoyl-L-alanine amidase